MSVRTPRVKLVPLTMSWTCPKCQQQNVVGAILIAEHQVVYSYCSHCNTRVILGERRKGE